MLENPLYIGERIIDYADIQQDIRDNLPGIIHLDKLNNSGMLVLVRNYLQFVVNGAFKEQLRNEYGVDLSRPLQYKKFSRPVAVNPITQEWGYVDTIHYDDDGACSVSLEIENAINADHFREWENIGPYRDFILIWEGLVHEEITGGIHT